MPRDIYLNRLIAFQDTEPVKVIAGIRHCGKSSLLKLMQKHLLETGIEAQQMKNARAVVIVPVASVSLSIIEKGGRK